MMEVTVVVIIVGIQEGYNNVQVDRSTIGDASLCRNLLQQQWCVVLLYSRNNNTTYHGKQERVQIKDPVGKEGKEVRID